MLADADLEHALGQVINGAMMSTGQKCTATSRAIVERGIADRFTPDAGRNESSGLNVGDPLLPETQIGPLIDERAAVRVADEVNAARANGAELLVGGSRLGGDLDEAVPCRPGALRRGRCQSRLGQEEAFGPVLGVISVDSLEEAMAVANQVKFLDSRLRSSREYLR